MGHTEKNMISASEAARILGCSPQMVRERIKRGIWKFGEYIPKEKSGNGTKATYCIYRSKLYRHMGKEEQG